VTRFDRDNSGAFAFLAGFDGYRGHFTQGEIPAGSKKKPCGFTTESTEDTERRKIQNNDERRDAEGEALRKNREKRGGS